MRLAEPICSIHTATVGTSPVFICRRDRTGLSMVTVFLSHVNQNGRTLDVNAFACEIVLFA